MVVIRMVTRGVAALGLGLVAAVGDTGTASADVSITPTQAVRGDAAELTLRVTGDRDGAYTRQIELRFPAETPIAEVYPMSVPDWAPKITNRAVDQPLNGVHHGTTTQVVSAITWLRVTPAGPSDTAELRVSLGPLPDTDRLPLGVVQTYSDGTVVDWTAVPGTGAAGRAAPVLTLVAPDAAQAPAADDAPEAAPAEGSRLDGGLLGGIAFGVVLGAVLVLLLRRRREEPAPPAGAPAAPEPPAETDDTAPGEAADAPAPGEPAAERVPATASRRAWRLRE
ncbi:YcnI family protein [Micromonospora sp. NPDC049559]|uniref:YcnI family copper-binding membrane protein n=1 Tax=Micromonospora sp. NPDC049559 TaxID=3155923 RepID=UPI00342F9139